MVLDRKKSKVFLTFFALSLSIVILRYLTDGHDDSSFHYASIINFARYTNLQDFWKAMMGHTVQIFRYDYSDYPLFGVFLYFISKTRILTLSSAIVAFFTYFCLLYPVVDLYKNKLISQLNFLLAFLTVFILNNYRYTISGMRYCLVVAILLLLFYEDSKRNFSFSPFLLWYLIPYFIHTSALIYIILRLLYPVIKKSKLAVALPIILLFPIGVTFIPLLANYTNIGVINLISQKIISYTRPDAFLEFFGFKIYLKIYTGTFLSFLYIIINNFYQKNEASINEKFYSFINLGYFFSLLNVGMIPYYNLWDRHIFILFPYLIIALLMMFSTDVRGLGFNNKNIQLFFIIICIVSMIVGLIYNLNFRPHELLDYSYWQIFTSNIFEFFTNIPRRF
ncbi:hypothetical protein ABZ559_04010 [Streptococcus sp. ZY19097]|uniref:hypothetical protein n=1 Tax=Streptococcus sp. ZY19097 TaxID=3231906 RepID=UPI0034587C03